MTTETGQDLQNVLYFNSVRNGTLAVLDSLNNVKHWVKNEEGNDVEAVVPIKFGNYEKSIALDDLPDDAINKGNFNYVPRMVLSFVGMSKIAERTTNKFQKISKRFTTIDENGEQKVSLNYGYNSVPYDFQFTLILQARGLNEAFMIIEQILPRFRPSMTISIQEYPLFDTMTETQLLIDEPSFEIMADFEDVDVNIINVEMSLNLRSNLYMPLQVTGPVEVVKLTNYLYEAHNYKDSQKASYYEFDVCTKDGTVYNTSERHYAPPKMVSEPEEVSETEPNCDANINTKINTQGYIDILTEDGISLIAENTRV